MPKSLLALALLFISATLLIAREVALPQKTEMMSQIDSLRLELTSAVGEQRLEVLNLLARSHMSNSPDSLRKYGLILLKESTIQKNQESEAEAYRFLGIAYSLQQTYSDSVAIFYQRALDRTTNLALRGDIFQSQAGLEFDQGNYEIAIKLFLQCATIFDSLNAPSKLANAYGGIGNVFLAQGQYLKALDYLHKCRLIAEKNNYIGTLLPAFANLATVYNANNQYDSAIFFAMKCYDLSEKYNQSFGIATSAQILSESFSQTQNYDSARKYAIEAKALFEAMGARNQVTTVLVSEAHALHNLGDFKVAEKLLKQAEARIDSTMPQLAIFLYETMKDNYHALNQNALAFKYFEKYHRTYEKMNEQERNSNIQELERRFETTKKEGQIRELQQENEIQTLRLSQQRTLILTSIVILSLLMVSIYLFYQKKLLREQERATLHKQQLLRSQINPHFIFNALTSIRGFLFEKHDLKEAVGYLGKFAKLMRLVLEHSSRESVTLKEEIEALEIYMEIQKMRFNNGFNYTLNIDPTIELEQIKVPPLLAQPFIENAIEHGFKNIPYEGKVEFSCKSEGDFIRFSIVDNGIGIDHVPAEKRHESKALNIFKERIGILAKSLKLRLSFNIKDLGSASSATGTEIEYTLPANWTHA